MTQLTTPTQL